MKKHLLLTLALVLCMLTTFAFAPTTASATTANADIEQLLNDFVTACPYRVSGTTYMVDVANWLADKFTAYGVDSVEFQQLAAVEYDQNVIATIDVPNATKMIVIGAHYDTASTDCVGANDNAAGVVTLLQIAQNLAQNKALLNFDVVLVAFAGEEKGLLGSYQFANQLTAQQQSDVALMVNIDSIASGDNLYVACENKTTPLLQTLLGLSQGCTAKLRAKPFNKGVFAQLDVWGYGYWEMPQNTDHTSFRQVGIPTASFFSGNYKSSFYGYVQSANYNNWTLNTDQDTLQNLQANAPDYSNKIQTVVQTVCKLVTDTDAAAVVNDARAHLVSTTLTNRSYAVILALGLIALAVVGSIIYNNKLKKKALLGVAEAVTPQVFTTPDAEDVFKF